MVASDDIRQFSVECDHHNNAGYNSRCFNAVYNIDDATGTKDGNAVAELHDRGLRNASERSGGLWSLLGVRRRCGR
jgi:hypothetical protein